MNVAVKIGPENLLPWADFEDWVAGTSAAPTGYTLTGASASVIQEATIVKQGNYSAKVAAAFATATIYYDLPTYSSYFNRQVTLGRWVYATAASKARIKIDDGITITASSDHSGNSTWEFLTVTVNISGSSTRLREICDVTSGATAYFDSGILCLGDTVITDISSYVEKWIPSSKFRIESFTAVRREGRLIPNMNFDDKQISIEGSVVGATPAAARTAIDALLKAMHPQTNDPDNTKTKQFLYLYDDRILRCLISGGFDIDPKASLRVFNFKTKYEAIDPFYRSIQMSRSQVTLSASPTALTVTPIGNVKTPALISFIPAGSNMTVCTLVNRTTGETMSFGGTVSTGNTLAIDSDLGTVTNNAVDSIASYTGDFIMLAPGANVFQFTGTTGGVLKIDWFDRFLFG